MSEITDHKIETTPIPPELKIQVPELTGGNVLDITTQLRYQLLRQYLADGQTPKDPKEASIVVKLLDGMDKQDLTKKRLDIERDNASANNEIARAALELTRKLSGESNVNPYERPAPDIGTAATPPKLDTSMTKDITITDGEKSLSPRDFSREVKSTESDD